MIRRLGPAVAAALLLVACGGDDGGSDETAAPTAPAVSTSAATTTSPTTSAVTTTSGATTSEATTSAAPATAATPTTAATTTAAPAAEPLRVLVTNDDGVAAAGIDAVVTALGTLGLDVTVVAPATQQSGQGGNVTDGPLTVTETTTASGYPAIAVDGFPADTVIWAIDQGGIDFVPDLVVSGSNEGQNLDVVADFSGTIGAARAAATRNIPAIAVSAGFGEPVDYASSTDALLAYLDEHLDQIAAHEPGTTVDAVVNINTPTCVAGSEIQGTVEVPAGTDLLDYDYLAPVDCNGTQEPTDDVLGFFNGYAVITATPLLPAASS